MSTSRPVKLKWYEIPAEAQSTECRACGEPIYFVVSPTNADKKVPVSCDAPGSFDPFGVSPGRGVSHFQTCTEPNRFSRSGR